MGHQFGFRAFQDSGELLALTWGSRTNFSRPDSTTCGLKGELCQPFHNRTFAFRCPATCQSTITSTPETIGDQEINYRGVVVGGLTMVNDAKTLIYRGDSFICAAAIHAGLLDDTHRGSGIVSLIGEHGNFPSMESNGIFSIGFTPSFPVAFTFPEGRENLESTTSCKDPRWGVLAVSVVCSSLLSIFTVSSAVFFGSVFIGVYFSVALALDPPDFENYYYVISQAFGGLLPALFVGLVIYHFCVSHTLHDMTAQFEKTILWLGSCWVGALDNLTLERLPLQCLTPHDLGQPGAIPTLMALTIVVLAIAFTQAWAFRLEGRMPRYLTFYALLGLSLLALITIPHMNLRLHHYIIALLLLPGTALQTRPSLVYQGFLVGLFINGVARWGFGSILQTPGELFGNEFNIIVPRIPTPIIEGDSLTFSWANLTSPFDGISMLVNDVERFHGHEDQNLSSFTWTRYKADEPEFFRFGYIKHMKMGGSVVGDYTKPATWAVNGSWSWFQ